MKKKIQHTLVNAEVTINAPQPIANDTVYGHCVVTESLRNNRVVITPEQRVCYPNNKKIFEKGRVKVMTRRDGSYMLSFHIFPESDADRRAACGKDLYAAMDAAIEHSRKKGGEV